MGKWKSLWGSQCITIGQKLGHCWNHYWDHYWDMFQSGQHHVNCIIYIVEDWLTVANKSGYHKSSKKTLTSYDVILQVDIKLHMCPDFTLTVSDA